LIVADDIIESYAQVDFHSRSELLDFPHIGKVWRTYTLANQMYALDANREQLGQGAAMILRRIDSILKGAWANQAKELARALGDAVSVRMDAEVMRFLIANPAVMKSATTIASSLRDLVGSCNISEMSLKLSYDIELETEKPVMCLKTQSSKQSNPFELETQILSYLDTKLSDDDKLRIAVRVE
jgi:hypothetical protein